jgi:hypothetical protein
MRRRHSGSGADAGSGVEGGQRVSHRSLRLAHWQPGRDLSCWRHGSLRGCWHRVDGGCEDGSSMCTGTGLRDTLRTRSRSWRHLAYAAAGARPRHQRRRGQRHALSVAAGYAENEAATSACYSGLRGCWVRRQMYRVKQRAPGSLSAFTLLGTSYRSQQLAPFQPVRLLGTESTHSEDGSYIKHWNSWFAHAENQVDLSCWRHSGSGAATMVTSTHQR